MPVPGGCCSVPPELFPPSVRPVPVPRACRAGAHGRGAEGGAEAEPGLEKADPERALGLAARRSPRPQNTGKAAPTPQAAGRSLTHLSKLSGRAGPTAHAPSMSAAPDAGSDCGTRGWRTWPGAAPGGPVLLPLNRSAWTLQVRGSGAPRWNFLVCDQWSRPFLWRSHRHQGTVGADPSSPPVPRPAHVLPFAAC